MSDLQTFIKNRDLELTLLNEQGDVQYIGPAVTIRALKGKDFLKFETSNIFQNIFPFTIAILHSGRNIFTAIMIKPVRPDYDIRAVEIVYG